MAGNLHRDPKKREKERPPHHLLLLILRAPLVFQFLVLPSGPRPRPRTYAPRPRPPPQLDPRPGPVALLVVPPCFPPSWCAGNPGSAGCTVHPPEGLGSRNGSSLFPSSSALPPTGSSAAVSTVCSSSASALVSVSCIGTTPHSAVSVFFLFFCPFQVLPGAAMPPI